MAIIPHQTKPFKQAYYSKLLTRSLVEPAVGAYECQMWEQHIPPGGYIIPHTHPTEEVLLFLEGTAVVTLGADTTIMNSPCTILVPPHTLHGLQNEGTVTIHLFAFFPTAEPAVAYPGPLPTPAVWD